jgi:penicillin-insensitive murein DD-endopeptidase
MPWVGNTSNHVGSVGTTSVGLLAGATRLPKDGKHYRFYHDRSRRYGMPELNGMLDRASTKVAESFPGSVLMIGDLSAKRGGSITGHRSHRSGRDVDLAFYVTDVGRSAQAGLPLVHFDRFGVAVRDGKTTCFDIERNWGLVEAMLSDEEARVQWIFVSNGLKAMLLEWALNTGVDLSIIERAASVLHQPGDSAPHDDHFHVRLFCPNGVSGAYCVDTGPVWHWIVPADSHSPGIELEELVRLALEDVG